MSDNISFRLCYHYQLCKTDHQEMNHTKEKQNKEHQAMNEMGLGSYYPNLNEVPTSGQVPLDLYTHQ